MAFFMNLTLRFYKCKLKDVFTKSKLDKAHELILNFKTMLLHLYQYLL